MATHAPNLAPLPADEPISLIDAHTRVHDVVRDITTTAMDGTIATDMQQQRQGLWDTVDQLALVGGAKDERAVRAWGEAVDYAWFGDSSAPLPKVVYGGRLRAGIEFSVLKPDTVESIGKRAAALGMGQIVRDRTNLLALRSNKLHEPFKAMVRQTPTYKFLESFALEHDPAEGILTPAQRIARESQISETVRRTTAGADPHTVRRTLGRATYGLEDETAPRKQGNNQPEPFSLALTKLYDTVQNESATKDKQAEPITRLTAGTPQVWGLALQVNASAKSVNARTVLPEWYDGLEVGSLRGEITEKFMNTAIKNLLDGQDAGRTGKQEWLAMLDACADAVAGTEVNKIIDASGLAPVELNNFLMLLKQPPKGLPKHSKETLIDMGGGSSVSFMTAEDIQRRRERTVGMVQRVPARDRADTRLLRQRSPYEQYESPAAFDPKAADMLMETTYDRIFDVAGYTLLGYNPDTATLGYAYNPESDPHTPNTRTLTLDEISKAEAVAERAGMDSLAAVIRGKQTMTVEDLLANITAHQTYRMPRAAKGEHTTIAQEPRTPEDIKNFINPKTGMADVQCDAAGDICAIFINESGIGVASPLNGLPISMRKGGRVSGMEHRQTAYIDTQTGSLHITDTTPTPSASDMQATMTNEDYAEMLVSPLKRSITDLGRLAAKTVVKLFTKAPQAASSKREQDVPALPVATEEAKNDPVVKEMTLMSNRDGLIRQFSIAVGSKDAPYPPSMTLDYIRRRPSVDLMRLAMEVVEGTVPFQNIPAAKEAVSHGRAQYLLGYIDDLRKKPEATRDPHNYTARPAMLRTIEQALRTVAILTKPDTVA
jgi:hypothetical protein